MKKRDILILSVILAIPLIAGVIIAGVYKFDLGKSDWITLVTSCISTFAAIFLGYMVFFQTENHKKRSEEDNQLYQEQAEKNRQQDLMLRANPYAVFNKIDCIRYSQGVISISKEEPYNRLTNIDYKDFHVFEEHVYMDLNFIVLPNNVLERVFINSVQLNAYKGEFAGGQFEPIAAFFLKNHSIDDNMSNIKVNSSGGVDALLSLLFDLSNKENFFQQEDVKTLLNTKEIKWAITIYYTLTNSFNIEIDYKTHINFTLAEGNVDEYGDIAYKLIQPLATTIQTSNIRIKEKTNESNT